MGLCVGMKLAQPFLSFAVVHAPELGLLVIAMPTLKPLLRAGIYMGATFVFLEIVVSSITGMFCGGVFGFVKGSMGVLRLTAGITRLLSQTVVGFIETQSGHRVLAALLRVARSALTVLLSCLKLRSRRVMAVR